MKSGRDSAVSTHAVVGVDGERGESQALEAALGVVGGRHGTDRRYALGWGWPDLCRRSELSWGLASLNSLRSLDVEPVDGPDRGRSA